MTVVDLKVQGSRAAVLKSTVAPSPRLESMRNTYGKLSSGDLLEVMVKRVFSGEIAVVSSFGAESAVLLHMIAEIDPTTPVIFLNTGKLFGETLRYRDRLQERFGLTDLRASAPHPADLTAQDPNGGLWNADPDACCFVRKVLPLERALAGFAAIITGRKRFQTNARAVMHALEEETVRGAVPSMAGAARATRFKINPLAQWDQKGLESYSENHQLPRHPLVMDGYLSIGCMPCTQRVPEGGSYRDGRWVGHDKDECGIHLPINTDGDGI